jgi:hypothetical protein
MILSSAYEFLQLLVGVVGIFVLIYELFKNFEKIKKAYKKFKKEVCEINFAELILFGIISTFLGGLLYNIICDGTLGGSGKEPHGIKALVWGALTNLPSVIILLRANSKISILHISSQFIIYSSFLFGVTIGGWTFYDFPISGFIGIRAYLSSHNFDCVWIEGLCGLLWSTLIGFCGFFCLQICRLSLGLRHNLHLSIAEFIIEILTTVIITSLSIVCFVIVFGCNSQFDTARGVIAQSH